MRRLILLEGTVGSGKSTTGRRLAEALDATYWFGFDPDHPIQTRVEAVARRSMAQEDFDVPDLDPTDERVYTAPQWARLAERALDHDTVLVLEGKYFQQCLEYLYLLGASEEDLFAEQARIVEAIAPLAPTLLYFDHGDVRAQRDLTVAERPPSWTPWLGKLFAKHPWGRARGLAACADTFHAFYDAWLPIERALFERHRGHKGVVLDAYLDREGAAAQIDRLLAL